MKLLLLASSILILSSRPPTASKASFSDDFAGTGASLGANWFVAYAGIERVSGQAQVPGTGYAAVHWVTDTNTNNQYNEIVVDGATFASFNFLVLCRTDATEANCYFTQWTHTGSGNYDWIIRKNVGGTGTTLTSGSSTMGNGDTLRFEVNGTTLTCKKNGTTISTTTDSAITSGKLGIAIDRSSGTPGIESWAGGDL